MVIIVFSAVRASRCAPRHHAYTPVIRRHGSNTGPAPVTSHASLILANCGRTLRQPYMEVIVMIIMTMKDNDVSASNSKVEAYRGKYYARRVRGEFYRESLGNGHHS